MEDPHISDQQVENTLKEIKRNETFCPNCSRLNKKNDEFTEWIDLLDSFVFTCTGCKITFEIVERERQILTTKTLVNDNKGTESHNW